jgi:hypothetical protein
MRLRERIFRLDKNRLQVFLKALLGMKTNGIIGRILSRPKLALRTTLLNLKQQDTLINIPLYAIGVMPHIAGLTIKKC